MAVAAAGSDWGWFAEAWVYAAGALAGGKLLRRPRVLALVGLCMALWQCW